MFYELLIGQYCHQARILGRLSEWQKLSSLACFGPPEYWEPKFWATLWVSFVEREDQLMIEAYRAGLPVDFVQWHVALQKVDVDRGLLCSTAEGEEALIEAKRWVNLLTNVQEFAPFPHGQEMRKIISSYIPFHEFLKALPNSSIIANPVLVEQVVSVYLRGLKNVSSEGSFPPFNCIRMNRSKHKSWLFSWGLLRKVPTEYRLPMRKSEWVRCGTQNPHPDV